MMAPTPGATWIQRDPTAISLVAMAMPTMPVRSHRPMRENVVNSIPIKADLLFASLSRAGRIMARIAATRASDDTKRKRAPDAKQPRVLPRRSVDPGPRQDARLLRERPGLQGRALRHHQGPGRRADPPHLLRHGARPAHGLHGG